MRAAAPLAPMVEANVAQAPTPVAVSQPLRDVSTFFQRRQQPQQSRLRQAGAAVQIAKQHPVTGFEGVQNVEPRDKARTAS